MAEQQPSVGRIVYFYYGLQEGPIAAIITAVHKTACDLTLFHSSLAHGSVQRKEFVEFSETPKPQHWSWPPRV
jgi:hypothetical protein